ncbi:MAG: hypothetical protein GY777_25020 [Candidatus Brocadiaceae bacterium]|nr:hypothetical protein [Candidatus Brocadiaceae bacterium]
MSSNKQILFDQIPEYINGSLTSDEKQAFDLALESNAELKQEYEILKLLEDDFCEHDNISENHAQDLFRKIENNIASPTIKSKDPVSFINVLKEWFSVPQYAWAAAAVQFLLLIVVVINNPNSVNEPSFRTLSENSTDTPLVKINVIFTEEATQKQLVELLQNLDAEITQGPSRMGLMVLGIESKDTEKVIAVLLHSKLVEFAEIKN